jgi:hypothetical protein
VGSHYPPAFTNIGRGHTIHTVFAHGGVSGRFNSTTSSYVLGCMRSKRTVGAAAGRCTTEVQPWSQHCQCFLDSQQRFINGLTIPTVKRTTPSESRDGNSDCHIFTASLHYAHEYGA